MGYVISFLLGAALCALFRKQKPVVHCSECTNAYDCQIRIQAVGDEGYCSLGKSIDE